MKSFHGNCLIKSRTQPSRLQVAAALIVSEGRVFIAQRPPDKKFSFLWEFPGGKVERGESLKEALRREIWEELCWRVDVGALFHRVSHPAETNDLDLFAFWCSIRDGELCLKEHVNYHWALPVELDQFVFTRPDREIISLLQSLQGFPDPFQND